MEKNKTAETNAGQLIPSSSQAMIQGFYTESAGTVPFWVEEQQIISALPSTIARTVDQRRPLIPKPSTSHHDIMFPLSSDHLITLLQYNVLRACLANQILVSALCPELNSGHNECEDSLMHVSPGPVPGVLPQSLQPTHLQQTIPHESWVDIIPDPIWRDNLLMNLGQFDEDQLWSDTIGGLFEGFPHSEIEHRGVIVWSSPWHLSGWEMSEGFWHRWGWTMKGCHEMIASTNRWRELRGEEPLMTELE